MSSAILYLAIIAIWAGILIPRWLKRDSGRGNAATSMHPHDDAAPDDGQSGEAAAIPDAMETAVQAGGTATPMSRAESRKRMLAARRRLLAMMLGLEGAGAALAITRLAPWWVMAPPTVMLAGYLLLLRAAAQADAERDAQERQALQAAQARRPRPPRADITPPTGMPVMYAAAPVPEDCPDPEPGRDFTPGSRYSPPSPPATEEAYDQYTENRLRAVGD
jgi:hypothetical protein